jgi:hypothetical protein
MLQLTVVYINHACQLSSFIPPSPTVITLNSSCQQQAICLPCCSLAFVSLFFFFFFLDYVGSTFHLVTAPVRLLLHYKIFFRFVTSRVRQDVKTIYFKERTGSSGKSTALYSGGAQFDYRPEGFILSILFSVVFLRHSKPILD